MHLFLLSPVSRALTISSSLGVSPCFLPEGLDSLCAHLLQESKARPLGLKSPTSFLQDIWVAFPGNTSLPGSASKLASPFPHFRFLFF